MIKLPWNAIRWGYKAVIDQIIEEYKSCPNMVETDERLYCATWWRHDDCLRLMELLNKITNKDLYSLPEIRSNVLDAIDKMAKDPDTIEVLKRLEGREI